MVEHAQGTLASGGALLVGSGISLLGSGTQTEVGLVLVGLGTSLIVFRAVLRYLGGRLPNEVAGGGVQ